MDPRFTVYPRYYVSPLVGAENNVKSDGDPEIVDLHSMYMNRTARSSTWGFQQRVFAAAHRLFGPSYKTWLELQLHNPRLVGLNLEYLNDTTRYLQGENRRLEQPTWFELFSEWNDGTPVVPRGGVSLVRPAGLHETAQIVQAWCRRPQGFDDLICSLNAFFGKARRSG